jgi:hypothetical protein
MVQGMPMQPMYGSETRILRGATETNKARTSETQHPTPHMDTKQRKRIMSVTVKEWLEGIQNEINTTEYKRLHPDHDDETRNIAIALGWTHKPSILYTFERHNEGANES